MDNKIPMIMSKITLLLFVKKETKGEDEDEGIVPSDGIKLGVLGCIIKPGYHVIFHHIC